jgi:hypothetical protein
VTHFTLLLILIFRALAERFFRRQNRLQDKELRRHSSRRGAEFVEAAALLKLCSTEQQMIQGASLKLIGNNAEEEINRMDRLEVAS